MTGPDKGSLQVGTGPGGGVLVDTAVVSRGILGLGEVDSSSLGEGCEDVSLVTTDNIEGMVEVEGNEGKAESGTDGRGCAVSTRGIVSCLFPGDRQDHRANSTELWPVLAGRLDGTPESTRNPDGRLIIIVPEQSPPWAKG